MDLPRKIPLKLVFGLAAAVAIDTALQIFWKTAVLKLPESADSLASMMSMFREPLFIVVICMMSLQFINWMTVLNQADLSFAQPFTALSYVSVGILSAIFLGETVDSLQMAGVAFVIAGVWFISRTNHMTAREGVEVQKTAEHKPSPATRTRDLIQQGGV